MNRTHGHMTARLVELPLPQALDVSASLLQESDAVLPVATQMLERIRQGLDDEDGAKKILRVLSLYGSPHAVITDQLLELLSFCEYPVLIIEALTSLTGKEEEEVHKVVMSYRDYLSSEGTHWLPILGSLSEMQLPEQSRKIGFSLARQSINVVAEDDVPTVVKSLLRTMTKITSAKIIRMVRNQCNSVSLGTQYLVLQVINNMSRIDSAIPRYFLKQLKKGTVLNVFDVSLLLHFSMSRESETRALQCLVDAVAEGRLLEAVVVGVCKTSTESQEWAHLVTPLMAFVRYMLSSVVQVSRGLGVRNRALLIFSSAMGVLLKHGKENGTEIVSMLATIAVCSPCLDRLNAGTDLSAEDTTFFSAALVGVTAAKILFQAASARPQCLLAHGHVLEEALFRPLAAGNRALPLSTLHHMCHTVSLVYRRDVGATQTGPSLSSSSASSSSGPSKSTYARRQYGNLLISVQKILVSGVYTGQEMLSSAGTAEGLSEAFCYQRTGMVMAMKLLKHGNMCARDRNAVISWVLRVMMASSFKSFTTAYGLDLLSENASSVPRSSATDILEKVVLAALRSERLVQGAPPHGERSASQQLFTAAGPGRRVPMAVLDMVGHYAFLKKSHFNDKAKIDRSCTVLEPLWQCFLDFILTVHAAEQDGEEQVFSACCTTVVMPVCYSQPPRSKGVAKPTPVNYGSRHKKKRRIHPVAEMGSSVESRTENTPFVREDARSHLSKIESVDGLFEVGFSCTRATGVFCTASNFIDKRLGAPLSSQWRRRYDELLWQNGIKCIELRVTLSIVCELLKGRKKNAPSGGDQDSGEKALEILAFGKQNRPLRFHPTTICRLFSKLVASAMGDNGKQWDVRLMHEIMVALAAASNKTFRSDGEGARLESLCAEFTPTRALNVVGEIEWIGSMEKTGCLTCLLPWCQYLIDKVCAARKNIGAAVPKECNKRDIIYLSQALVLSLQTLRDVLAALTNPDAVDSAAEIKGDDRRRALEALASGVALDTTRTNGAAPPVVDSSLEKESIFNFLAQQLVRVEETHAATIVVEILCVMANGSMKAASLSAHVLHVIQDVYPLCLSDVENETMLKPVFVKPARKERQGIKWKLKSALREINPMKILVDATSKGACGVQLPPKSNYLAHMVVVLCALQLKVGTMTHAVGLFLDAMERRQTENFAPESPGKVCSPDCSLDIRGLSIESAGSFFELLVRIAVSSLALSKPRGSPGHGVMATPYDDYFLACVQFSQFVELYPKMNLVGVQTLNSVLNACVHSIYIAEKKTEELVTWRTSDESGGRSGDAVWFSAGNLNAVLLGGTQLCCTIAELCASSKAIAGVDFKVLPLLTQMTSKFYLLLKNLQDLYHIKTWDAGHQEKYTASVRAYDTTKYLYKQSTGMSVSDRWSTQMEDFLSAAASIEMDETWGSESDAPDTEADAGNAGLDGFVAVFRKGNRQGDGSSSDNESGVEQDLGSEDSDESTDMSDY